MPFSLTKSAMSDALAQYPGVDLAAIEMVRVTSWHEQIEQSAHSVLAMQSQFDSLKGLLSASAYAKDFLKANSAAEYVADQERHYREAVGPLAQLRVESMLERERAMLFESAHSSLAMTAYSKAMGSAFMNSQISALESVQHAYEGINETAKSLFDSLDAKSRALIDQASLPYAGTADRFNYESASVRSMRGLVDGLAWTKSLQMPIIDAACIAAVAKTWGIEGAWREISSLGLDASALQTLAASLRGVADFTNLQARSSEEGDEEEESKIRSRRLSPEMWMSIFGVLLAILVPIWQKMDSDATEARLVSEFKDAESRSAARMEALAHIVERMLEQSTPKVFDDVTFVVRARVTLVKRDGRSGATVVAEVFPNQVVKLVSERGKWIEVRYFDWRVQEERSGWSLKKYFMRVGMNATSERPSAWEQKETQ